MDDNRQYQTIYHRESVQRLRSREPYRLHIREVEYQRANVRILIIELRFR